MLNIRENGHQHMVVVFWGYNISALACCLYGFEVLAIHIFKANLIVHVCVIYCTVHYFIELPHCETKLSVTWSHPEIEPTSPCPIQIMLNT